MTRRMYIGLFCTIVGISIALRGVAYVDVKMWPQSTIDLLNLCLALYSIFAKVSILLITGYFARTLNLPMWKSVIWALATLLPFGTWISFIYLLRKSRPIPKELKSQVVV